MSATDLMSLEVAKKLLGQAVENIRAAIVELGQLDRCPRTDYPGGTPPLRRCVRETGHPGAHKYDEEEKR